jgi:hypothetical protein
MLSSRIVAAGRRHQEGAARSGEIEAAAPGVYSFVAVERHSSADPHTDGLSKSIHCLAPAPGRMREKNR